MGSRDVEHGSRLVTQSLAKPGRVGKPLASTHRGNGVGHQNHTDLFRSTARLPAAGRRVVETGVAVLLHNGQIWLDLVRAEGGIRRSHRTGSPPAFRNPDLW